MVYCNHWSSICLLKLEWARFVTYDVILAFMCHSLVALSFVIFFSIYAIFVVKSDGIYEWTLKIFQGNVYIVRHAFGKIRGKVVNDLRQAKLNKNWEKAWQGKGREINQTWHTFWTMPKMIELLSLHRVMFPFQGLYKFSFNQLHDKSLKASNKPHLNFSLHFKSFPISISMLFCTYLEGKLSRDWTQLKTHELQTFQNHLIR